MPNFTNHIGLVKKDSNGAIIAVKYYVSKFEREVGDVMNFEGSRWTVEYVGTSRNDVIDVLNTEISKINKITAAKNKITRAKQRIENRKVDTEFNSIIADCISALGNY